MDNAQTISQLTKITEQLKLIASSIGVSTGVEVKKGGVLKLKPNLTREEKNRAKQTATETANVFNRLGLGFKQENVNKTATTFKTILGISSSFFASAERAYAKIESSTTDNDILNTLNSINTVIGTGFKDYEPILTSINSNLNSINTILSAPPPPPATSSLPSGKQFVKGINAILRIMDWVNYRDTSIFLLNHISESLVQLNTNIAELVDVNRIIQRQTRYNRSAGGVSSGKIFSSIKGIAGMLAMGGALFLIVNALLQSGKINAGQIFKVIGVMAALIGVFSLMAKIIGNVKDAAIGFGILSATVLFLILPMVYGLNKMSFGVIIEGMVKLLLIISASIGVLYAMSKINSYNVLRNTLGLTTLLLTLLGITAMFYFINKINYDNIIEGLLKMIPIFLACWGMVKAMSLIKSRDVIRNGIAVGLLSALMSFVFVPLLIKLSDLDYKNILIGLGNMALAITGLTAIVGLLGFAVQKFSEYMISGTVAFIGLSLLLGIASYTMSTFADKDWDKINQGIKTSLIAITSFGVLVGVIGALGEFIAPFLLVGGAMFLGLAAVMAIIANSLTSFNAVDPDHIKGIGESLAVLGLGLVAFLGGTISGVGSGLINGFSSFFGLDPVSQIKKFETIDSDKLSKLGSGIKNLSEGLKSLSSGIDLTNAIQQMRNMISPIEAFSGAIDTFSKSYNNLNKIKLNPEFNLKFQEDNSIQLAIKSLNEQELAVQISQLEQLERNGEYLRDIASRINSGNTVVSSQQKNEAEINYRNFSTKNDYTNNLKLATMSFA